MSGSTAEPVVMEAVGDGRQVRAAKLVVRTAPGGPHNDQFGGPALKPDPGPRHNDHFGGSPTRCPRWGDESHYVTSRPTGGTNFAGDVCPQLSVELTEPAASFTKDGARTDFAAAELVVLNCGQGSRRRR